MMTFSVKQIKAILSEAGIPTENLDTTAEQICSRHNAVDSIKEERDNYKKDAETLATVQKELDELKSRPDDGYKAKYEAEKAKYDAEHKAYEDFKTATENEKTLAAKKTAFKEVCKDAGLNEKGVEKAIKYADWDTVELDDTGKVKDAKTHIKTLKEEWAEHVTKTETKGSDTPNPPNNNGGKYKTRDEIMAIKDDSARQKAIAENHELFGF